MTSTSNEITQNEIENIYGYKDDYDNTSEQTILLKKRNVADEKGEDCGSNSVIEIEIENKVKPKRVYWVDWLRVFASILVVYIHVSYMNIDRGKVKEAKWNKLFIHNSLPRHCVPIFVTISGIFFLNPNKELALKKLYVKNILHMVKSLYFWGLIYATIDNYVIKFKFEFNKNVMKNILDNIIMPGGHFWYLYFVIGLYIKTPLYRCLTKERNIAWYTVVIAMIYGQLIPTIDRITNDFFHFGIPYLMAYHRKVCVEFFGNYSVYYLLGYLLYTHEFTKKSTIKIICIIGFVSQIITVIFRFIECFIKNKEANDFGEYNSLFVSLTTIGTYVYFKYYVSEFIEPLMEKRKIKTIILKLSECSFGVYLVHMIVFNFFNYCLHFSPITFDPLWFTPIYTVIIYIISFLVIYLLRLIPIFKQVT